MKSYIPENEAPSSQPTSMLDITVALLLQIQNFYFSIIKFTKRVVICRQRTQNISLLIDFVDIVNHANLCQLSHF